MTRRLDDGALTPTGGVGNDSRDNRAWRKPARRNHPLAQCLPRTVHAHCCIIRRDPRLGGEVRQTAIGQVDCLNGFLVFQASHFRAGPEHWQISPREMSSGSWCVSRWVTNCSDARSA